MVPFSCIVKESKELHSMIHPYFTTSFADREMFAHNKRVEENRKKTEKHLSDPYNRIRYAYDFLGEWGEESDAKCMKSIYNLLSLDIDCEVHY
jgi:hypothetical protein